MPSRGEGEKKSIQGKKYIRQEHKAIFLSYSLTERNPHHSFLFGLNVSIAQHISSSSSYASVYSVINAHMDIHYVGCGIATCLSRVYPAMLFVDTHGHSCLSGHMYVCNSLLS